jgi:2-polyprenyl-6-methoxyphenol hydroxylase-like FAD-dependent oxidoreductase
MSFPSRTTVIVVGAGPVGMACALSLWLSGVKDIVLVEAAEHGNGNIASRAFAIHAATLDVSSCSILGAVFPYSIPQQGLDLIGCADALVERGLKATTMSYYDRSFTPLIGVDFNGLIGKTNFPFCLLLPQHLTEHVLSERLKDLGVPIFRPYKVSGMRENLKDSGLVDVSFENGQSITAQYVIGADGGQSAVRTWILVLFRC